MEDTMREMEDGEEETGKTEEVFFYLEMQFGNHLQVWHPFKKEAKQSTDRRGKFNKKVDCQVFSHLERAS